MKLSVVVPALNEESHIGPCLAALRAEHDGEVFVVDGGSSDGTEREAKGGGATVLRSERGYARQVNHGAHAATGDVFFFLAADSRPEPGWYRAMERAMEDTFVVAGGFRLRLDDRSAVFRLIELGGNLRASTFPLALPDQGLFVRKSAFLSAGLMLESSLIPNARLCFELRRFGEFRLLPERVLSSARKWHEGGVARTTLRHMAIYRQFRYRELPRERR